jgi:cytochrome P450
MLLAPLEPHVLQDPHPVFGQLRAEQPVFFDDELGMWVVSRFEDVHRALRDQQAFGNARTLTPVFPVSARAATLLAELTVDPVSVEADPPTHPRTRKAMVDTFATTPRGVLRYEPMVRKRVGQLVSAMLKGSQADLIRDFAWQLPILVVLDLLGVPESDFDRIKAWSDGQLALVWGRADEDEQVRLATGMLEFWQYCQQLTAERMSEPRDDLPSALVRYRNGDDDVLTEREIASIAFNLLVAGHETTANLLGNGVFQLLTTEGAWQRIAADPSIIPQAVEEMLRHDPPIISWLRVTNRDTTLGDVEIPAGQRVLLVVGSANRDETRFTQCPAEFDIDRSDAMRHISFGAGPHFCIGAALSRLEARLAFEALTERIPGLRLVDGFTPSYLPNIGFRGLRSLPVTWT